MRDIAVLITIGGKIKKKIISDLFFYIKKNNVLNIPIYIVFRNDSPFYRDLIFENEKLFKKIVEIKDEEKRKLGKIKEIINDVDEKYIKILDPDDFLIFKNLEDIKSSMNFAHLILPTLKVNSKDLFNVKIKPNSFALYDFAGTAPTTIHHTECLKFFSKLNTEYDKIYQEDIYRFLFSSLISITKFNMEVYSKINKLSLIYVQNPDSESNKFAQSFNWTFYKKEYMNKKDLTNLELIFNDLKENIYLINEKTINHNYIYIIFKKFFSIYSGLSLKQGIDPFSNDDFSILVTLISELRSITISEFKKELEKETKKYKKTNIFLALVKIIKFNINNKKRNKELKKNKDQIYLDFIEFSKAMNENSCNMNNDR